MSVIRNQAKNILRKRFRNILKNISVESRHKQSIIVTEKILSSEIFKKSNRISIYLSTEGELSTNEILREMFRQNKQVFVPSYEGGIMEMLKLNGMDDYDKLPMTKWNIKQPSIKDNRENALTTGGLDLFVLPGVAFSMDGKRLGHGKAYYDKYLKRHFDIYPKKFSMDRNISNKLFTNKTIVIALAFNEQILSNGEIPLDPHDFIMDKIVTTDSNLD